jgi:CO/xanthine dehydrogenase Mo-binding subunit
MLEERPIIKSTEYFVINKSILDIDSKEIVTGRVRYTDDLTLSKLLYVKVKRSTVPHAKIIKLDTSKAEKYPGVRAVITSKDIPEDALHGLEIRDQPILARDRVRYIGDPIAAVAAENIDIAEEAIELIEVEYEELPAVFDPEESMKPEFPIIIHPDLENYEKIYLLPPEFQINVKDKPNIHFTYVIRQNDVDRGFKEADLIIENRFQVNMVSHAQIEPHSYMAEVYADNNVTVWSATQTPHRVQFQLSHGLKIPMSKIRIISPRMGGAFGGKAVLGGEGICVLLAKKAHRPVKLTYTREEMFIAGGVRHPFIIYIKDGIKRNGRIVSRDIKAILNGGAYATRSLVAQNTAWGTVPLYKADNFKIETYRVYTNLPNPIPYRGFGNPEIEFAIESQMDIISKELGIDPVEFRLNNIFEEGEINLEGGVTRSFGGKKCLEEVAREIEWKKPFDRGTGIWRKGRGIACGVKYSTSPASCAFVKVHSDGTIEVRNSTTELGQGARTIFAQIAAEEFKTSIDNVKVVQVDTDITPYHPSTTGSVSTASAGNAIILACNDAKKQIIELASKKMKIFPEDLFVANGKVIMKKYPRRSMDIKEIFEFDMLPAMPYPTYIEKGAEIIGRAAYHFEPHPDMPKHVGGRYFIASAQAVDLEVNIETGQVRIIKFICCADCGKAINRINVEGQILGGALGQGIGTALSEEMVLINGKVANPNFVDYKCITSMDLPPIDDTKAIIIEIPHDRGPYGAKGIGEVALCATAPAISAAIYDAIGIRMKCIPMTLEKIYMAIKNIKKPI